MTGEAVVGPWTGKKLKWLPSTVTTWAAWFKAHPDTTVVKPPRPIAAYRDPYSRYRKTQRRYFPDGPNPILADYEPKSHVTIAIVNGKPRCYPHAELREGENKDGDVTIVKKGIDVQVLRASQKLPSQLTYWFSWCAYYPNGRVFNRE